MHWMAAAALVVAGSPAGVTAPLSPADEAAAFQAAGFKKMGGQWRACDDPGTASHQPGRIAEVLDANGDGLPEAVITESSSFCYAMEGNGYAIVSQQAGGKWRLLTRGSGIPLFLPTKGVGGWPDLMVGGPGFCFPVERWNGKAYVLHRHEYEGKRCQPRR
jgi:hypothetical protein